MVPEPAPTRWLAAVLVAAACLGWAPLAAGAPGLSPDEDLSAEEMVELGRRIYFQGAGEEGHQPIAVIGRGGAEVPASVLPCSSCHGEDGRGRPEGGVNPSDLTWSALTRPYVRRTPDGREHPPYDEARFQRAVTMGLDPGGNPLHVAMPLYRLTHAEADALVAFIKTLDTRRDDGIEKKSLHLGLVLPPAGTGLDLSVRSVLEAASAETETVHDRRIALRFVQPHGTPAERRSQVASFLAGEGVLALVAPFLVGAEDELVALLADTGTPAVGPFALAAERHATANPYVFYLVGGLEEQARSLLEFAVGQGESIEAPGVLTPMDDPMTERAAHALRDQAGDHGAPWADMPQSTFDPASFDAAATAGTLRDQGIDALFFLGAGGQGGALERAAGAIGWRPRLYLLGSLAGADVGELASGARGRLHVAFPSLPSANSPRAYETYRRLASEHGLPAVHLGAQLSSLAAFEVLVEALERAGRKLSREKLVAALESLYLFDTSVAPALTFGPNRRIGALGAYVVSPDSEQGLSTASSQWIELY